MSNAHVAKIKAGIGDAVARGWVVVPSTPGTTTLRWTTLERTPSYISSRQWPSGTYEAHVFVTFIHPRPVGIKAVANPQPSRPWVGRSDQGVSVKKALEILTAYGNETAPSGAR